MPDERNMDVPCDPELCPVCGKPTKKTFTLFDKTFTVDCICECDKSDETENIDR